MSRLRPALRRVDGPRAAPVTTLLAGVLSAAGGALAEVPGAPLGALVGAVVVVGFFWTGAVPLLLVGGEGAKVGIGLVVLLMTYVLRLIVLLLALAVAAASDAVDLNWLAVTVIACTLVWIGTQVALVGRSRVTL